MTLADGMNEISKEKRANQINSFMRFAKDYAEQGLEEEMIKELLVLDGCDSCIAKELADSAINNIPEDYVFGEPPVSFNDVRERVLSSLKQAPIDKYSSYFEGKKKYADIKHRILLARDNKSEQLFGEILREISPLVDDLIVQNKALASSAYSEKTSEVESLEQDLFGVWPVELIKKYAQKEKASLKFVNRKNFKDHKSPFMM